MQYTHIYELINEQISNIVFSVLFQIVKLLVVPNKNISNLQIEEQFRLLLELNLETDSHCSQLFHFKQGKEERPS